MKKLKILVLIILALSLLSAPAGALGFGGNDNSSQSLWMKNATPFQAEMVTTLIGRNGQKNILNSRYFFMPNKIRTEDLNNQGVLIINLDKKVSYMFSKQSNVWIKVTPQGNVATAGKTASNQMSDIKTKNLPDTVVDGKPCTVTQYSLEAPEFTSISTVYIWKGKNIPLKIINDAKGVKSEIIYKNIVFTKTPETMFLPPVGAQVMDLSQMMAPKK